MPLYGGWPRAPISKRDIYAQLKRPNVCLLKVRDREWSRTSFSRTGLNPSRTDAKLGRDVAQGDAKHPLLGYNILEREWMHA